ncbi:AMP-binding protein [Salinibacterium sp. ZJ70]|uniref:AMP-binding protein n=1 Tax=Salinibacterium sp. ZJ70 TaxID=2708084 RepID=UPI00141EEFD6|nr:AMP-binding protein [Salinibacterium sp. ZJ70]
MKTLARLPASAGHQAVLEALHRAFAGGDALFVASGAAGASAEPLPERVPQRTGLIVETSGSTGRPKRVVLSTDAVLASAAASESALGGPAQWVLALPVNYIAGLNVLARSLCAETEPVAVTGERFTVQGFVDATARLSSLDRATALVPAQLAMLLEDAPARDALRTFQAVLVGGQSTPRALLDRAREAGVHVVRSYGSSETAGGCVYDGVPLGGTRVAIVDGEVRLAGPTLAEGYLDDEQLTSERFVEADGTRWFRTADAGEFADDVLRVVGRRDDVLVSGGVKVALGAIEEALARHPGFEEVVVVAVPDERWGERPVAVAAGPETDDDAAIAAVAERLGPVARPARVIRVDALPRLASGKPDRRAITLIATSGEGH